MTPTLLAPRLPTGWYPAPENTTAFRMLAEVFRGTKRTPQIHTTPIPPLASLRAPNWREILWINNDITTHVARYADGSCLLIAQDTIGPVIFPWAAIGGRQRDVFRPRKTVVAEARKALETPNAITSWMGINQTLDPTSKGPHARTLADLIAHIASNASLVAVESLARHGATHVEAEWALMGARVASGERLVPPRLDVCLIGSTKDQPWMEPHFVHAADAAMDAANAALAPLWEAQPGPLSQNWIAKDGKPQWSAYTLEQVLARGVVRPGSTAHNALKAQACLAHAPAEVLAFLSYA